MRFAMRLNDISPIMGMGKMLPGWTFLRSGKDVEYV
jgi:hypothetical protein